MTLVLFCCVCCAFCT